MSDAPRILVVDDEEEMLDNCRRLLTAEGYECFTLAEPLRIRETVRETDPDLLFLDLRMPGVDGMTALTAIMADAPTLPVIVITAFASISSAVRAIQEGAFDYLAKPFTADQLLMAGERALRYRALALENEALRAQVRGMPAGTIVGSHPTFLRLLDQAQKVAQTDANVLLTGESGTGKEVLARYIHNESPRRQRPFIPVDCAAMPAGLLESELFGHERGAFTGAVAQKQGLLSVAAGGTAFLDEITELSVGLQSKLLRVLEERKLRRVGSAEFIDVDVRIIAASNADMEAAVEAGTFRRDLFYRLNVVPLRLPPLRERKGDVPLLMQRFLQRAAEELGRDPPQVSPEVWEALERHDWPGNVREVRNLAHRLVALHEDKRLRLSDLPESIRGNDLPKTTGGGEPGWLQVAGEGGELPEYEVAREQALKDFLRAYVQAFLSQHDGSVTRAARAAGVSRRTFHRWLSETGTDSRGEGVT